MYPHTHTHTHTHTHSHLNTTNDSSYHFENRGKIYVKGLGLRTTYFVEPNDTITKTLIQVHPLPESVQVSSSPESVQDTTSIKPTKTSWTAPLSLSHRMHSDSPIPKSNKTVTKMRAGHLKCPFTIYHNDSIESDVDAIPVM